MLGDRNAEHSHHGGHEPQESLSALARRALRSSAVRTDREADGNFLFTGVAIHARLVEIAARSGSSVRAGQG